jgi:hypothetical protein
MTKDRFENRLEALFDAPPALDDNLSFAARVEKRVAGRIRLRTDLTAASWIVTGGAVLWGLVASLDAPSVATATAQIKAALSATEGMGGVWLLPALAIGGALTYQAVEDALARD